MLIALYLVIMNVVIPQIEAYFKAFLAPVMVTVIILAGIVMMFGAVGIKITNNLGTTVISGIFSAIGYICRTTIKAIAWVIRNIFKMIPRIFNGSRRTFRQLGMSTLVSNLLALFTVVLILAIII